MIIADPKAMGKGKNRSEMNKAKSDVYILES